MTKRNDKNVLRSHEYTARPRQTKTEGNVLLTYWSVRCRRQGMAGEWGLGWFATRRAAEQAFFDWVATHRATQLSGGGADKFSDVVARYIEHVQSLSARPNTIANKTYTASQLQAFLAATCPTLLVGKFDAKHFDAFRDWLLAQGYKPQTVLNAVVGTRCLLRWAVGSGLVANAPVSPKVTVPPRVNKPVFVEDFDRVIAASTDPSVRAFLELMWEAGLRYAEVESLRLFDVDVVAKTVCVCKRGNFVPKRPSSYRTVPISDELCDVLASLAKQPQDRLFPCPKKHPYQYWRHRFDAAQAAAGITSLMSFHDLRRAVADRLRRTNATLDVYCKYMGHAAITGLRHYSTVDESDLRKAHGAAMKGARRRQTPKAPAETEDDV
jgi:integrase